MPKHRYDGDVLHMLADDIIASLEQSNDPFFLQHISGHADSDMPRGLHPI